MMHGCYDYIIKIKINNINYFLLYFVVCSLYFVVCSLYFVFVLNANKHSTQLT